MATYLDTLAVFRDQLRLTGVYNGVKNRSCGVPYDHVKLWDDCGTLRVTGLTTCRSVHNCPFCRYPITSRRANLVKTLALAHFEMGGTACMATFTLRSRRGMALSRLLGNGNRRDEVGLRGLLGAYQIFTESRLFSKKLRSSDDPVIAAGFRGLEVTFGGSNGFHPHLHVQNFISPGRHDDYLRSVDDQKRLWLDCLKKVGCSGDYRYALNFTELPPDKVDYIVKVTSGLGSELADHGQKLAHDGHFTVCELESLAVESGQYVPALHQIYRCLKGRRQLTSFGRHYLRSLSSDDLDSLESSPRLILEINRESFRNALLQNPNVVPYLREVFEAGADSALWQLLVSHGLEADKFLTPEEVELRDSARLSFTLNYRSPRDFEWVETKTSLKRAGLPYT